MGPLGWLLAFSAAAGSAPSGSAAVQRQLATTQQYSPPATFFQTTMALNPLGPKVTSHMTLILRPSINISSDEVKLFTINIFLPDFVPVAERARDDESCQHYFNPPDADPPGLIPSAQSLKQCLDDLNGLHRIMKLSPQPHGSFESFVFFNTEEGDYYQTLTLYVKYAEEKKPVMLNSEEETELVICCFILPMASAENNRNFQIEVISTDPLRPISIDRQPVKKSPLIVRGNYWKHLQIQFEPPLSLAYAIVSVIVQSAQSITNQAKVIVRIPGFTRLGLESGNLEFNTVGNDWLLFEYYAYWNITSSEITFQLREGAVLEQGRKITLRTRPGEFQLPIELVYNDPAFTVECRSQDGVDEIIPATSVMQSDRVPHVREFEYSHIAYEAEVAGNMDLGVSVHLTFQTNRPMFTGTIIYLKLPGFSTPITSVPLEGSIAHYFYQQKAEYNIPLNLATLTLDKSLYSNEKKVTVILRGMMLPTALYLNDPSIKLWTSDDNAVDQPVMFSPAIGGGKKEFVVSEVGIDPPISDVEATINFLVQPSVDLYEANEILFHLHGFRCPQQFVPLEGPDSAKFGNIAQWDGFSALTMRVAKLEMISRFDVTNVTIPKSVECRSPLKLSKDDGILAIESSGALIRKESIKKSPAIGTSKYLTQAVLEFEPAEPMAITKLTFTFTANADILPNSTIKFRLGGIQRNPLDDTGAPMPPSGYVMLSGVNAPSFVNSLAYWDNGKSLLTAVVIPTVLIGAGKQSRFFIEQDQRFKLPYAMYQQDPSLLIGIPASGMKMQNFNFTTRVNREGKRFKVSKLLYGKPGGVAYPGLQTDLRLTFQPNVALREGTVIRLYLPGFRCPHTQVELQPLASNLYDQTYRSFLIVNGSTPYAEWNEETETLDFTVAPGKIVENSKVTMIFLKADAAHFRVPLRLDVNDPHLTIQALGSQIIREETIKESDPVVPRAFDYSYFMYTPQFRESTFLFSVNMTATVDITENNPIIMHLPGFRNVLAKDKIHITGRDGARFELPMGFGEEGIEAAAKWEAVDQKLKLWPKPGVPFKAFESIVFTIEESNGFILPRTLFRDDDRLKLESENNILPEPVKTSPLIGDGPYENQRFCLIQYEKGTRTRNPRCRLDPCIPALVDPCSARELERCLCDDLAYTPGPLTIHGFQMYAQDVLGAIPIERQCDHNFEDHIVPGFRIRNSNAEVTTDREELLFTNLTSSVTGFFRLCVRHFEDVYDVGKATVRPSCNPSYLVMVEGICVEHCPPSKKPVAGECINDPVALQPKDQEPILVGIGLKQNSMEAEMEMFAKDWEDPERQQFTYQFQSNLAKYLHTPIDRFRIAAISNASDFRGVVVNVVLLPLPPDVLESEAGTMSDRSPAGLLSLLRALQADESSSVYESKFFRSFAREYRPPPVKVYECRSDGEFRTSCPYVDLEMANAIVFFAMCTGVLAVVLMGLCMIVWRLDADVKGEGMDNTVGNESKAKMVDPSMQSEFARSWLESRYMLTEKEVRKADARRDAKDAKAQKALTARQEARGSKG
jgi:hypothetical protein